MKYLACGAILLLTSGAALAGETFKFDGGTAATGQTDNTVYMVGDDHVFMHSSSQYDPMGSGDPKNPLAGMTGPCFGAVEIKGTSASGDGYCIFSDSDGNTIVNHWVATGLGSAGALLGTWEVKAGSGKFFGTTGGGAFSNSTNKETGTFSNEITGAMTMP